MAPIVARLGGSDRVEAFARAVLRRVARPQLELADPAVTAAALADAFAFVNGRDGGRARVRLIDPVVTLDGSRPAGTVLEVSCEDRPFLASSLKDELHRLGLRVAQIFHPVFGAERDAAGTITAVLPARPALRREAFLQVVLVGRVPDAARPSLEVAVRKVLDEVHAVTQDHLAMRRELERVIALTGERGRLHFPADEVTEAVALLEWLLDDNFVLLGSCRIGDPRPGLGILSRPGAPLCVEPAAGGPAGHLVSIVPSAEHSAVGGRRPMNRVEVVEVGEDGPAGVFRVVGVFSRKAEAEPAAHTPTLRVKLRRILELEDVVEGSEEEAALTSLFQVLPKEELFASDVPQLREVLAGLLAAEDQQRVQALVRAEPSTNSVSALMAIPQDRYSPALRQRIERFLLNQLDGARVDTHVTLGDRADAILRMVVHVDGPAPDTPLDPLARELRLLARTWDQELAAAVGERMGEAAGRRLARAWAEWFPDGYRTAVAAAEAVDDILQLDRLARTADFSVVLAADRSGRAQARLKVYSASEPVELSRFMPILESLGLWAVEERVHALGPLGQRVHLHDFAVTAPAGGPLDLDRDGPRLAVAASALWHGRAEVDSLNRLVLQAAMDWRDVALLRAYHRFRNQVAAPFTTAYVTEVLIDNPEVARATVELFAARFDPRRDAVPDEVADIRRRVDEGCDAVARLDHDRVLRSFAALVDATLRTNRYFGAGTHLALKFDSARIPGAHPPIPYREIFVYGPKVEGVHLRWGPVARGGIRRSERLDDYRSEVLGLVRAQVLKNALIVPTGAKGGFVVKRGRHGQASPADGREAYEIFVRCLLELTDNVVEGRVVPVATRQDGDDPYLVVAADRGTAGFSDLANRISMERGFWLGDAFASGGSHGYHHKRLGITARGAWVAVRQHFAELGIDLEAEPVTMVGIGDMSGDVFGNFLLRSDQLRLVAAFDHRDVFVDPEPDPERSYQERLRLFGTPSSSWQDYDRSALSPGGGVWSRLVKRIRLTPQARAVLGVEEAELTPPDLIRAILQAPVGLLFAGGIGTFVRASTEADASVDDRANSEIRVEGSAVRARVVGEGANLAFTQRARIEFARRGGRINTDAIDNSAGVDISDREVNLKILLRSAVEAGEITGAERDRILDDVCPEVVAAVLDDCAQQSLALSRSRASSPERAGAIEAVMSELEAAGMLDRAVEALPTTEEMRARARAKVGLTRPELAVLLAGAKRGLTAHVLASDLPDQAALRAVLAEYFPAALSQRFNPWIGRHRLRRELISSRLANAVVNRMGPTFTSRLGADTGAAPAAVAAAYWIAAGVAGADAYWRRLDGRDGGPPAPVEVAQAVTELLESLTRTYLHRREEADIAGAVNRDRPAYAQLERDLMDLGSTRQRRRVRRRAEALVDSGVDGSDAMHWAGTTLLTVVPDVAALARESARDVTAVAQAFLLLSEGLGIDRLLDRLGASTFEDRWSRAAGLGLMDDLDGLRRVAARSALFENPAGEAVAAARRFLADRSGAVHEIATLIRDLERDAQAGLEAVTVVARAIRRTLE